MKNANFNETEKDYFESNFKNSKDEPLITIIKFSPKTWIVDKVNNHNIPIKYETFATKGEAFKYANSLVREVKTRNRKQIQIFSMFLQISKL